MSFRFFTNQPFLAKCAVCGATACNLHGPFAHIDHMKSECPIVSKVECVALRDYRVMPDLEGRALLRFIGLTSTTSFAGLDSGATTLPST